LTLLSTILIITLMLIMMVAEMFLTPSCGSCEFVANFPELSYLQLGYLATSEVPGARNSVPSEAIFLTKKMLSSRKATAGILVSDLYMKLRLEHYFGCDHSNNFMQFDNICL